MVSGAGRSSHTNRNPTLMTSRIQLLASSCSHWSIAREMPPTSGFSPAETGAEQDGRLQFKGFFSFLPLKENLPF